MKASARRISSHADGPDVARARGRPATSAPNGPISSARSVPRRGKAPGWSCPGATPTPCGAPHRDRCRRRSRAHAVLIVDQAGWHLTPTGDPRRLALPPRSPELNPVENVWQFMRDNWLSNRLQILRRHRRAVLPSLEQPHRPTMRRSCPSACANGRMGSDQSVGIRWPGPPGQSNSVNSSRPPAR